MNKESKEIKNTEERDDGSYVVNKNKKSNILAFIICVLVAFIIWAYTVTKEQKIEHESESNQNSVLCEQSCENIVTSI